MTKAEGFMKGQVAKEMLERNENLHQVYLSYEAGKLPYEKLKKEEQDYINTINSEYKNYIKGKTTFQSLSKDAKYKTINKVVRAYMRRKSVKTNSRINAMAQTTNGTNDFGYIQTKEIRISSVFSSINEAFEDVTGVTPTLDTLSIYGLHALNLFKENVLELMKERSCNLLTNNSKILLDVIDEVSDIFDKNIDNGKINLDEIYHLRHNMTPASAEKILENLSKEDIEKCLKECNFNNIEISDNIVNNSYNSNNTNQSNSSVDLISSEYFDSPYGNKIYYNKDGNYYTQSGKQYFGPLYKTNDGDGEEFIYVNDIDKDEVEERISQKQTAKVNKSKNNSYQNNNHQENKYPTQERVR